MTLAAGVATIALPRWRTFADTETVWTVLEEHDVTKQVLIVGDTRPVIDLSQLGYRSQPPIRTTHSDWSNSGGSTVLLDKTALAEDRTSYSASFVGWGGTPTTGLQRENDRSHQQFVARSQRIGGHPLFVEYGENIPRRGLGRE